MKLSVVRASIACVATCMRRRRSMAQTASSRIADRSAVRADVGGFLGDPDQAHALLAWEVGLSGRREGAPSCALTQGGR